ncbi:MAG: TolC family protein [Ekhidna sp.]
MRQLILLLLIGIALPRAFAQEGQSLSLDECIQYAVENAITVQNAILDQEIAKSKVKETVGIGLPQVSGSIGLQHSPTLQRFFSAYNPNGGFGVDTQTANDLGIDEGEVFAAENFFQLKSAGDMNLTVNQLIFNGSYIVGLQASNAYQELSIRQANQTREEVALNVSKAYYNLLILREQLELLDANVDRIDTLYYNTAAMVENGFAEKIDADRIKVTLNNLKSEQANLSSIETVSIKLLKLQMNYPFNEPMDISGDLSEMIFEQVESQQSEGWSYNTRPDYQVMEVQRELQNLNIKNKYAEALPTLGAFATLGRSTQSPNFGGLFKSNSSFTEVEDQIGVDSWYGYSALGLSLSWNLFTGLQRNHQIQQQKMELEKIENGFTMMEQSIDLEIEQSNINLSNAQQQLEVQDENQSLATEIYTISKIKYEEGVGSNLEVIEANTALKEAQTNYYSALYNAIIAQLELKKALGILYNN